MVKKIIGKCVKKIEIQSDFKLNMYLQKCCLSISFTQSHSRMSFVIRSLPWRVFFIFYFTHSTKKYLATYRRYNFISSLNRVTVFIIISKIGNYFRNDDTQYSGFPCINRYTVSVTFASCVLQLQKVVWFKGL